MDWINLAYDSKLGGLVWTQYWDLRLLDIGKGKGKGYPCTGTEALYMPYGS